MVLRGKSAALAIVVDIAKEHSKIQLESWGRMLSSSSEKTLRFGFISDQIDVEDRLDG